MKTIQSFFDKIFLINLRRRKDRLAESVLEFEANGISPFDVERFEAYDHPTSGTHGCTVSHRTLLRKIANGPWGKVLVLEDDFAVLTKSRLAAGGFGGVNPVWTTFHTVLNGEGTLNQRFDYLAPFIPEKWDVLYLAAGYGEPPISRYNKHVIRCGAMKTTSSYGITREMARFLDERVTASQGSDDLETFPGHIDDLISESSHDHLYYVLQPRLLYQRKTFSDIEGKETCQLFSMSDPHHESMV